MLFKKKLKKGGNKTTVDQQNYEYFINILKKAL